jgi:hypothetical protein
MRAARRRSFSVRRDRRLRRVLRALARAPAALRWTLGVLALAALWAAANWTYHALRKPTELLFPVSDALVKTPEQTWREYGADFRRHATAAITPELLAALAQVEAAGNPLARTYWRWAPSWHPFEIYRPASSAVGMYQITDATFAGSRPECRDPAAGGDPFPGAALSCRLGSYYDRVMPGEAIALAAGMLDRAVAGSLKRERIRGATPQQKQDLAAVIHLCGAGAGLAYARQRFRPDAGQRCGDHDLRAYLARVGAMKLVFARLARDA